MDKQLRKEGKKRKERRYYSWIEGRRKKGEKPGGAWRGMEWRKGCKDESRDEMCLDENGIHGGGDRREERKWKRRRKMREGMVLTGKQG